MNRIPTVRSAVPALPLVLASLAGAQPVHELLEPGVARSFASPAAQAGVEASVALLSDPASVGGVPGDFSPLPVFSFQNGQQTVTVPVAPGTNLYGTGFQSGPFERTGRRVEFYNLDNFGWGDFSNRNYQTHPWVLGVRPDGTAFGVLFDSTWASSLDLEQPVAEGIIFQTEGPSPRVITFQGATPKEVVQKLAEYTGMPFMPPMWSVGYHQSRFSYVPQSLALGVAQEFRNRQIPAEVIWMDIDYMDNFKNFTFNSGLIPNAAQLNSDLDNIGFQGVWMANCGIAAEGGYFAFGEMAAQNLGVQRSNGSTYFAQVWPGTSVWPDFTMQSTRDWWAGRIASFASIGVDGIWNDMNEPAVFNVASKTMPDSNLHRADADLGGTGPHRKYHNIYGMQMSRATRQGLLQHDSDKRPFVLTRAGYIGGQRYAAMWTGDNVADWYHVGVSIQNILNIGLSGQPNAGPDIGGFNGDNGGQHYARWMGIGAMMPFARGHYAFKFDQVAREPWSYGSGVENTSRLALNRRYRLLNYIYTQFHEAHTSGLPVCRPLMFAEPANPELREWAEGFLVGPGLLVVGATKPGAVPQLPPMETPVYRLAFNQTNDPASALDTLDPDLPDLYVLGGHIVVANEIVQHSRELTPQMDEPIELIVGLDENGTASGTLYEDAGDGFEYESGSFRKTTFSATRNGNLVSVDVSAVEGNLGQPTRPVTVRVLLGGGAEATATASSDQFPIQVAITEPQPDSQPAPGVRDGRLIAEAFEGTAVLATNNADRYSEISQLRALYARPVSGGIEIGIEGELAIDGTAIALLVDSASGGPTTISTSNLNPPPSGLQQLTGTDLDTGFTPERMLFANAFNGGVFCDWVTLSPGSGGSKTYLGQQNLGSGSATLFGGNNPWGIEVALGSAGHAAGSGFEIFIPYSALPDDGVGPLGVVRVYAATVKGSGQITNQSLPSVGNDWPGFSPDFRNISGDQFANILTSSDLDQNGAIDIFDAIEFLRLVDAGSADADLVGPIGVVNGADASEYLLRALGG